MNMDDRTRILIFGASAHGIGWLTERYARYFNRQPQRFAASISTADVTNGSMVATVLDAVRPDVVINTAGKTHGWGYPNIDGCQASQEAKDRTYQVNTIGAGIIGRQCLSRGIYLVHLGSGCIFDGSTEGGFKETDTPNPVSWYAWTKVQADEILSQLGNTLILRIRMPISGEVHPRNLITKLAGGTHIINVLNSVTVVDELLQVTEQLMLLRGVGIYHVTNPVPVRHEQIMDWYCEIVDPDHRERYQMVGLHEYKTLARRSNCVLSTEKLQKVGIHMSDAPDAIRQCLAEYRENLHPVEVK